MVVLAAMIFGRQSTIIICGAVTFGLIKDYDTKITTGISIWTNFTVSIFITTQPLDLRLRRWTPLHGRNRMIQTKDISTRPIVIGLVLVAIATLSGHQAFANNMPESGGIAGPSDSGSANGDSSNGNMVGGTPSDNFNGNGGSSEAQVGNSAGTEQSNTIEFWSSHHHHGWEQEPSTQIYRSSHHWGFPESWSHPRGGSKNHPPN